MNVLFVTIGRIDSIEAPGIYSDLLRCLRDQGHSIYTISPNEKRTGRPTEYVHKNGTHILNVATGNITKVSNLIEKGISTLSVEPLFVQAMKQYFKDVRFDLVLYSTPPITFCKAIAYIKKRDGAKTYLLLKDIFPQNAVDIGMMKKSGIKGLLYRFFRAKEKKLYAISDRIGCMSRANVDYVLRHNPEIDPGRVEVCPNSIQVRDMSVTPDVRTELRRKYGIPQDKKVFVYGGNLGKPQGIPFLMECLDKERNNPDAYFLIVGGGTEYKKLEGWFAENQPRNARLLQRLPKEDYDRLVAACDVGLIFLDHRFTIPNFPSRLLSYMQAKLPVLCCTDPNTDIGKTCSDGGFGWGCESNDTAAFAAAVDAALAADLPIMGDKGYAYLQANYTVQKGCHIMLSGLFGEEMISETA